MTTVNVTAVENTVVVTENGSTIVVAVPVTSTVTATTTGPQGPKGDAGAGYDFIQSSSSATWTINHNLGHVPSVEVFDSGSQEVDAEISHTSPSQTLILFSVPLAGFARLI